MLLLIDNYDSFSHLLLDYFKQLKIEAKLVRNDAITLSEIQKINPDYLVLSPGPGSPNESGISLKIIEYFKDKKPILGVCLGHQCIGQFFGLEIVAAERMMHGKTSLIVHDESQLFKNIPSPFKVMRYHSLLVKEAASTELLVTAYTQNPREIMALQHRQWPIYGVQFHPESIGTDHGLQILQNFLDGSYLA